MKIYLLRHGETDWNKEKRLLGSTDIPLNENGRRMARKTAAALEKIPFEAVFSSPLCRAAETAKLIRGERGIPFATEDGLAEISFGIEEGKDFTKIKKDPQDPVYNFYNDPAGYQAPEGGESLAALHRRADRFLRERIVPLEKKYDVILLVSHGAWIRTVLNGLKEDMWRDFWKVSLPNCAVSVLVLENGVFRIEEAGAVLYE